MSGLFNIKGAGSTIPNIPGLNLEDPEIAKHADQIWSYLDELSHDPVAYKAFIEKQKKDAERATPSFVPVAGFCVMGTRVGEPEKSSTSSATLEDTTASPSLFAIPELQRKHPKLTNKIFLNMTHSDKVQVPQDSWGKDIDVYSSSTATDGLTVPLSISDPRVTKDNEGALALAVDIVFNPWVIKQTKVDDSFKTNVINLVLSCLEDDRGIRIIRPVKVIRAAYKGLNASGDVQKHIVRQEKPRPKPGDETDRKPGLPGEAGKPASVTMDSPSSLLKSLSTAKETDIGLAGIALPSSLGRTESSAAKGDAVLGHVPAEKKLLFEEISEIAVATDMTPAYAFNVVSEKEVVLVIELPGMDSMAEAQLDIAADSIAFVVPGRYDLKLKLPRRCDADSSRAKFSKKHHNLTITLACSAL